MTEYAGSTELTAARVRHLAHRGQLPETAWMLAWQAERDWLDAFSSGRRCMARAKYQQYRYWWRRRGDDENSLYLSMQLQAAGFNAFPWYINECPEPRWLRYV
jgi:hypothetical protein